MKKRHFVALANMLLALRLDIEAIAEKANDTYLCGMLAQWDLTRDRLADFCEKQFPKFDRERWLEYVENGKGKG